MAVKQADVLVIGSGAAGAAVTKRLADLGITMNCQEYSACLLPELCALLDRESASPRQFRVRQQGMHPPRPELFRG